MSQRAALREMDAVIVDAFKAAGLADAATYTAPGGGAAVDVDVLVDRGIEIFGGDGADVPTRSDIVTLYLAQVAPVRGGTVVADGDTFTLCDEVGRDASSVRWTVKS